MLSRQLHSALSTVTSALKEDISAKLSDSSENFVSECKAIVLRYDQSSKPKEPEVYQAALLYLKGQIGEDIEYLYDLVAFGLYMPIESLGNKCVAYDQRKLEILLNRYREEARRGQLWEMTWLGVLQAYYHPEIRFSEQAVLLGFLNDTWRDIVASIGHRPLWMQALEKNPGLLMREPCRFFTEEWLAGHEDHLRKIALDLQIPDKSWFWHELTGACIKFAADKPDDEFKRSIPKLISLLKDRPSILDEGLNTILYRYNQCGDRSVHDGLKAFVIHHWKNPKLRHDAAGSKWLLVPAPVWRMVLGWVNDAYLRLFFERISARYGMSKDRLSSWLRYIAWTKLVSDYETNLQQQKDPEITRLFEAEEEALLSPDETRDRNLDVFIRRIGDYLATV